MSFKNSRYHIIKNIIYDELIKSKKDFFFKDIIKEINKNDDMDYDLKDNVVILKILNEFENANVLEMIQD